MSIDFPELQKARESAQRVRDNGGECAAWANQVIVLCTEVERLRKALERVASSNAFGVPFAFHEPKTTAEIELITRMQFAESALTGKENYETPIPPHQTPR